MTKGEEMIIQGNQQLLAEKAADLLAIGMQNCLKKKDIAVVAVPGGRSVAKIFTYLREHELAWSQVHFFLLDERLVAHDHPESNYKLIKEHLRGVEEKANCHPFVFVPEDPESGVENYKKKLDELGGTFDIVLASSGEDGHIASLFPNHHSVENRSNGFILMEDAPKMPPARVSASRELISQSDTGILLFLGAGKEAALHNFFNIYLSDVECPAKIMIKLNRYCLLTDLEIPTI